jgi:hypothetical protein
METSASFEARSAPLPYSTALLESFGFCRAAEPNPARQAEWERVIAGAKKEGEVRLWGDKET